MSFLQRVALASVVSVSVISLLAAPCSAQSAAEESPAKKADRKAQGEPAKRAYRGRLPNHWTKLELSEEQKEKIYAAQRKARADSAELRERLDKLTEESRKLREELNQRRDKLAEFLLSVLTDTQRKQLEQVLAEAAKRRTKNARNQASKETDADDPDSGGK